MLTSSFIFLPGVGRSTERRWWDNGLLDWNMFLNQPSVSGLSASRKDWYDDELRTARRLADDRHFQSFGTRLPRREHWRLYDVCRARTVYLDIETTGAPSEHGDVTVVGLHRNGTTVSLVKEEGLTTERLQTELDACDLLVTFLDRSSMFLISMLYSRVSASLLCTLISASAHDDWPCAEGSNTSNASWGSTDTRASVPSTVLMPSVSGLRGAEVTPRRVKPC